MPEYKGRHPCVVDNTGCALFFVDESTTALKGTGSKKSQPPARRARTQRKVTQTAKEPHATRDSSESDRPVRAAPHPARRRLPTPDEVEATPDEAEANPDETDSIDPPIIEQSRQRLLLAARTSPSGHIKKRPRTDSTILAPDSAPQSGDDRDQRPVKPLPRGNTKDLKRKHVDVASSGSRGLPTMHRVQPQLQQTARRPPDFRAHIGPGPAEGTSRAAQYHPSFHPQPFAPPHPYPHDGYMPPVYGHHPYPSQYGPPAWAHPLQHPREQWPAGQSQFNPEDGDPYNPHGRRNYGP